MVFVLAERVLSVRELNRALLARQLLLKRSSFPVTKALERIGGLQSQYAPSAYIGLWSRLHGFQKEHLTRALEQRRAIQGTLMRTTIHTVSAADYPLLAAGIRRGRQAWWRRVTRQKLGTVEMEAAARLVTRELRSGPIRAADFKPLIERLGLPEAVLSGIGLWVDLVRVPPSGTWERRRADLYALAETWVGKSKATEAQGLELLVRRYLGGFGPAPVAAIADWAGLAITTINETVPKLGLRRFRDTQGKVLFDIPGASLPRADSPAPVRFLPTWDATLLVHARRTLILPEAYRPQVFNTRTPQSVPTFLVDGQVAGTWRYEKGRVQLQPFHDLSRRTLQELEAEGAALAAMHAAG